MRTSSSFRKITVFLNHRKELFIPLAFLSGFFLSYVLLHPAKPVNESNGKVEQAIKQNKALKYCMQRHLAEESNDDDFGRKYQMMNFSAGGHSHKNGKF